MVEEHMPSCGVWLWYFRHGAITSNYIYTINKGQNQFSEKMGGTPEWYGLINHVHAVSCQDIIGTW